MIRWGIDDKLRNKECEKNELEGEKKKTKNDPEGEKYESESREVKNKENST